jgi:hypothetical protein
VQQRMDCSLTAATRAFVACKLQEQAAREKLRLAWVIAKIYGPSNDAQGHYGNDYYLAAEYH